MILLIKKNINYYYIMFCQLCLIVGGYIYYKYNEREKAKQNRLIDYYNTNK